MYICSIINGGLAERSNAPDLKSDVPERVPGVRIPEPPHKGGRKSPIFLEGYPSW